MAPKRISGQTDVPGIGVVHWTANEIGSWGQPAIRTALLTAEGPNGELDDEEKQQLRAVERRFQ